MTTAARDSPTMASGWKAMAIPTNPTARSSAAISPRQRVTSTRSPAKPSIAGRRVSDAMAVTATTTAQTTAIPVMNDRFIKSMPSSEMTTVDAAKATARPAVSMATTAASSIEAPACMFSR